MLVLTKMGAMSLPNTVPSMHGSIFSILTMRNSKRFMKFGTQYITIDSRDRLGKNNGFLSPFYIFPLIKPTSKFSLTIKCSDYSGIQLLTGLGTKQMTLTTH